MIIKQLVNASKSPSELDRTVYSQNSINMWTVNNVQSLNNSEHNCDLRVEYSPHFPAEISSA